MVKSRILYQRTRRTGKARRRNSRTPARSGGRGVKVSRKSKRQSKRKSKMHRKRQSKRQSKMHRKRKSRMRERERIQ